ncbi:MAG: head-tail adaptor protein [Silicimonas sp.]|nr:head-tail adaptor protein [Silicimonas sp.]
MRRLSRKLDLQALSRVADGAGGFSGDWQALGTLWAEVRPGRGRLEGGEGGARARASYEITLRAVPPGSPARPQPGQRLVETGRVYLIRAVRQSSDSRYLTCFADEEEQP